MAYVNPIANKQHLLIAEQHIKANFDAAYHLIWKIGTETGFRITDITEMQYSNINFDAGTVTIAENKGTKARAARARLKVLEQVKNELIASNSASPEKMMQVFITPVKDIYPLVDDIMRPLVDKRIKEAMESAPEKKRTARLSKRTLEMLKARQERYRAIDEGNIFSRRTLSSNRARNTEGVISRQSCWKVFSKLTDLLVGLGEKIKVGCHSLRKIFARHLYFATGKDIGLLMRTIGHSSPEMSLRYIGITSEEELEAQDKLFSYFNA
jgi:integrase